MASPTSPPAPTYHSSQVLNGKLSLSNPTIEFLHTNFTKVQLQKHCRSLGLANVWATKDILVEMIMKATQERESAAEVSVTHPEPDHDLGLCEDTDGEQETTTQQRSQDAEITSGAENSAVMEEFRKEIKKINSVIENLHTRLATLEAGNNVQSNCEITPATTGLPSNNTITSVSDLGERVTTLEEKFHRGQETQPVPSHDYTRLEQRISSIEAKMEAGQHLNGETAARSDVQLSQVTRESPPANTANTLLLGDINLNNIRMSDLSKNCKIRTLHEANLDLIRDWVKEQLYWTPATCVIYGGLFDLLDNTADTEMMNNLSALICELKNKNENMDVYVCQLVPSLQSDTLQTKISDLNEQIRKWSEANGISLINPDLEFRLGTGEIDEACYHVQGQHQGSLLNRLGAIRLLNAIGKQCDKFKMCVNWDNIKRYPDHYTHSVRLPPPPHHGQDSDGWQVVGGRRRKSGHGPPPDSPGAMRIPWGHGHPYPPWPRATHRPSPSDHYADMSNQWGSPHHLTSHLRGRQDDSEGSTGPSHPPYHDDGSPLHASGRRVDGNGDAWHGAYNPYPRHRELGQRKKIGCYNCGEFNHQQPHCRFDHVVKCGKCQRLGHKSKLCAHYSA